MQRLGSYARAPFILPIITLVLRAISTSGIIILVVHFRKSYYVFRQDMQQWLKGLDQYIDPKRKPRFRKYYSPVYVLAGMLLILSGLFVAINPSIIAPNAKPSPNYIAENVHVLITASVYITRAVNLSATPSILDKNNLTGVVYFYIVTPETASNLGIWNVNEIVPSSIVLNGLLHPNSSSITVEKDGTESMVATYYENAIVSSFGNQESINGAIALTIEGSLINGDSFQGSTSILVR